jgi:hypothetical protein
MKIRELTEKDVAFEIECMPEDESPIGHFQSGDPEYEESDNAFERKIMREVEWNQWVWCCVKVTAKFEGFEGVDFLGCCSYESQDDFEKNGYFEDMKTEALNDLNQELQAVADTVGGLAI